MQYPEIDNRQKEDHIYNLIINLVPQLGPLDCGTKYKDLDDAISEILARITILMGGNRPDNESLYDDRLDYPTYNSLWFIRKDE